MTETPKKVPGADIIDPLLPPEMALACEAAGVAKAGRDGLALIILGLLAGAFIAFGAIFMTVVLTGAGELPWGVARLLCALFAGCCSSGHSPCQPDQPGFSKRESASLIGPSGSSTFRL